jgi:hypothetical protein
MLVRTIMSHLLSYGFAGVREQTSVTLFGLKNLGFEGARWGTLKTCSRILLTTSKPTLTCPLGALHGLRMA